MKNFVAFTSLVLLCATSVIACAQADEEGSTSNAQPDAETLTTIDTAGIDTGNDGSTDSADTAPPVDSGLNCAYPATESKACGACGTQSRFCLPTNQWTGWTECAGEKEGTECVVGEKRTADCGNCGKQTDYCDSKTCTFNSGVCTGEGECAPGDVEKTKASCAEPSAERSRTCDDKCVWSGFSACAAPKGWFAMEVAPIAGRAFHSAVWTGSRMVVWGGGSSSSAVKDDGASYDVGSNKWSTIASSPLSARRQQSTVWTGSKMFVWGGSDITTTMKNGALYDPVANTWTAIPDAPLTARHSAAIAYSAATKEVLVWGGCTSGYCAAVANDGAAYNVETNTWSALPAGPLAGRTDAAYGLVNGELVIWGGRNASFVMLVDGARLDPVSRTWVKFSDPPSATLDGRFDEAFLTANNSLVLWGGRSTSASSSSKDNGAIYSPMVGWTAIPAPPDTMFSPSTRRFNTATWFGKGKLWLFSGIPSTLSDTPAVGFVSYELATDTWKTEDVTGVPGNRSRASAVWTGTEAIVFGGLNGNTAGTYYNTGAVYRP